MEEAHARGLRLLAEDEPGFWESLAHSAGICLHDHVLYGRNPHHIVEAQFKAVARALRAAAAFDPRSSGIPSTKGVL